MQLCNMYVSQKAFTWFSKCTCFGTLAYFVELFGLTVVGSAFDLHCFFLVSESIKNCRER